MLCLLYKIVKVNGVELDITNIVHVVTLM